MQSQMQELVRRAQGKLIKPWHKKTGRPKACGLYRAVEIACMYLRHNSTQEFLGDLRGISQSTVSRIVTTLAPIVKAVLEEFVPTAQEAIEIANGRVCLVDGTITPCWSYEDHSELWSRKHGTTGFNAQLICLLDGYAVYISDPLPGCTHDAKASTTTPVAKIVEKSGGGIGDKGYQGCGIVTPRKTLNRPAENLAKETKGTTLLSRPSGRRSKDSSPTSKRGGSSTPTTDAHIVPTATPTMPPADCSSSQLHVLNDVLSIPKGSTSCAASSVSTAARP
jgi:hypothetical protein